MRSVEWMLTVGLPVLAATGGVSPLAAQSNWSDLELTIEAEESSLEPYLGRDALVLEDGTAWLDGVSLRDGEVEFDLAVSSTQGFHGLIFRASNASNYEHIYVRPHQSGNPDATQYTPVYHGVSGWQIYASPRYSQSITLVPDRWMHVRIAFEGRRAELSVDGQTLVFPALERPPTDGRIGLTASGAPARFANLVVSESPPSMEGGSGAEPNPVPVGAVRRWRVSTPFAESRLEVPTSLDPTAWRDLEWATIDAGVRGIANLARLRELSQEHNTVFAAVTLTADEAGPLPVRFGFSDRVVVYLNGRPIYRGTNGWRSRDYRFLGTMGLFDEVIVPLEEGENELWLAVSESFGGWGVIAALPEGTGVRVSP